MSALTFDELLVGPSLESAPRRARSGSGRTVRIVPRPVLSGSLFVVLATAAVLVLHGSGERHFAWYGTTLGALLFAKLVLALLPARHYCAGPRGTVAAVVPIHNEDVTALVECLRSIEEQTRRPDALYLVDDASTDRTATDYARLWAASRPEWVVFVGLEQNVGKRHAQAVAFRDGGRFVDFWVTVDSDTVLEPDAVERGLRPLSDADVAAVTGTVVALNPFEGLLPALIDLRYANAFLGDRAAQSRLGSVLCCCGSLSFWRASVLLDNLEDWTTQSFLGKPATFGDDRRLTRYALDAGRVELARDAVGRTTVPERMGHYLRQQARWGRSFWRESYLMLRTGSPRRLAWWLTGLEVVTTLAFSFGMLSALLLAPLSGRPEAAVGYLGWVCLSAWARSVHIFAVRDRAPFWRTLASFAVAPAYGFLSLVVLLPLRLWSLVTLRTAAWGTRSRVEVALAPGGGA